MILTCAGFREKTRHRHHLNEFPVAKEPADTCSSLSGYDRLTLRVAQDVSATDKMSNSVEVAEGARNIKTRCVFIGIHATQANDEVVGFERLRGEQNSWSEALNVNEEVDEEVELRLVEPLRIPQRGRSQEIINGELQLPLLIFE